MAFWGLGCGGLPVPTARSYLIAEPVFGLFKTVDPWVGKVDQNLIAPYRVFKDMGVLQDIKNIFMIQ